MKKGILVLVMIYWCVANSFSQHVEPGFYLTRNDRKAKCDHEISSFKKGVNYCLTPRPIVSVSEFEFVDPIRKDTIAKLQYIDLWITDTGLATVKTSMDILPDSRMVLVLNNKVAGIFTKDFSKTKTKYIRISDIYISKEILLIYESLHPLVKYKSKEEMKAAKESKEGVE